MISRIRHGSSPAFQNVCHWLRGLKHEVARPGLDDVVAEQRAHPPLEHEAVLVLARVPVQRRGERARRHRVLDEREALARLEPVDHEAHADAPEEALAPVVGADHLHACDCRLHRSAPFDWTVVSREIYDVRGICQYDWTHMSDQKRPYRMKRRAELEEQTRLRITESAVALHEELGPAQHLDQRDRRARRRPPLDRVPPLPGRGRAVRRLLVALARGEPAARPGAWRRSTTRTSERATALRELYAFYGRTEAMYDEPAPRRAARAGRRSAGCATSTATSARSRTSSLPAAACAGRRAQHVRAAIGHALAFPTWRSLTREQGLGDDDAVELMCRLVEDAAI